MAAAVLACSLQRTDAQPVPTAITVVVVPVTNARPVYYAQRAGLFEKVALGVKIEPIGSGAAAAAAVAGGTADIGGSNIQTLIQAHARGVPFTIVAPGAEYDEKRPTVELVVLASGPIRKPTDIAGKSIGVASLQDAFVLGLRLARRTWCRPERSDRKTL